MKYSLGISNFLKEISGLSHSIVFLYFFALITEKGFLISPCYSLELCIQMGIRQSGTEPVIRIMVEASSLTECDKYIEQIYNVVKKRGYVIDE